MDDDESLRRALARALRRAGLEVADYASAEALLAAGAPAAGDCLVLDLDLPGAGGAELSRQLAAGGRDLPTVFITALDAGAAEVALGTCPPAAILYKPFDNGALLDAVGEACR